MLDLQPRVHFQEIEILGAIHDEFDGAGAVIADRLGQRHGLSSHGGAGLFIQQWRRRFLDHFLVTALDGAFALTQMQHIAVAIADQLDFNVAWLADEFFNQQAAVTEAGQRLAAR